MNIWQPHPELFDNVEAMVRFGESLSVLPKYEKRVAQEASKSAGRDSNETVSWLAGSPVLGGKLHHAVIKQYGAGSTEESVFLMGCGSEEVKPFLELFVRGDAKDVAGARRSMRRQP